MLISLQQRCGDLLPIPDELIRLVATKQLRKMINFRTAIPNRALPKQG